MTSAQVRESAGHDIASPETGMSMTGVESHAEIVLQKRSARFPIYAGLALLAMIGTAFLLVWFGGRVSQPEAPASMTGQTYWTVMQGMAALVGASALVGSAVFALLQYSNSQHERRLAVYTEIFAQFMSELQVDARRAVYDRFKFDSQRVCKQLPELLKELNDQERRSIKLCLNSLDYLGFLVCQGWLDDDKTLGWLSPIVVKTWECLEPVVRYERKQRQDPGYYAHCDLLAKRCARLDKAGKRVKAARKPTSWIDTKI